MDACTIIENCHLDSPADPTQMVVTVNIKAIAGAFYKALNVNVSVLMETAHDVVVESCFYWHLGILRHIVDFQRQPK